MSTHRADVDDLQARVLSMLQRGTVRSVNDALKMQALDLDLKHGHRPTRVEHWHPYGMSFHPHPGSEVLVAALGGSQDHLVVLGTADRRYRMKGLAGGELAIHDDQGQYVHFKRGGIEVKSPLLARIESPTIEIEGLVKIKGHIVQEGGITSTGAHKAAAHT